MYEKDVQDINQSFNKLVDDATRDAVAAHKSGEDKKATEALLVAHSTLSQYVLNKEIRKMYRNLPQEMCPCVCYSAERLGQVAIVLDLSHCTTLIQHGTYCLSYSYSTHRSTPLRKEAFQEVTEWTRDSILKE